MAITPLPTMSETNEEIDAFEAVYRSMLPTVYRFCTARLGRAEGEDVTSEVFHAAAIAWSDGRRAQVSDAWLMAVARNKVIDRWRKAERRDNLAHLVRPRRDELIEFPADWQATPRRAQVLGALDALSPRHRRLLIAHYVDGIPVPELAEQLGLGTSAVESALARARRAFRRHYPGEDHRA